MSPEQHLNIIEKIKKLFALSKSPNENEAAFALEKARNMMNQYNIEHAELSTEDATDIVEIDFALSAKFNTPTTVLAYWLGQAFNIKPIIIKTSTGYHKSEKKIKFIGTKADISVATYVYGYVLNLVDIKSKEYFENIRYSKDRWTPSAAKKAKTDFAHGFVRSISKKLEAMKVEREVENKYETEVLNALVVVKNRNIDNYIKDNVGKLSKRSSKSSYNREHFGAGSAEGDKHGIFRGVNGAATSGRLQLGL